MGRTMKFGALTHLLSSLPPDQQALRLSFAELEEMAHGPLPCGAWTSSYWSNSTVARTNWQPLGFRARLNRHAQTVTFTRIQPAGSRTSRPAALAGVQAAD